MTPTRTRVAALGGVFVLGLVAVVVHLWVLMVHDNEIWAARSNKNRWSFRSVPSERGALLDRFGRVLAHDEPTTELSIHYARFRLRNVIGAAVHGATAWARLQPARDGAAFDYQDGALGPEGAFAELMAMPASTLRPRALPRNVASELAAAVTTVLADCSGLSRKRVFAAVREAAQAGREVAVGDVLGMARQDLRHAFLRRWRALQQLHADLLALRAADEDADSEAMGLLATLEYLRRASLADEHITWMEDGEEKIGSKIEDVRRTFAERVPFDLAAQLRVDAEQFPGMHVAPSVRRRSAVEKGSTLHALLGRVWALDHVVPDKNWLDRLVKKELSDEWLADLESPDEDADSAATAKLQAGAKQRYTTELLRRERRGITGIELAFDDDLMGRLGMRLVEHDAKRREQRLWKHLRVEAGEPVQLTIDLDLQRLAEAATTAARLRQLHGTATDHGKVEAALAVIDAKTGDVLALAGAPIDSSSARSVPGVTWQGNGALGSVVKPFVLVEQLQCESVGRPHRPISSLEGCNGTFRYGQQTLKCSGQHWDGGRDAIEALAESCNLFYYQIGVGLEEAGLRRAMARFGLAEPPEQGEDPFAACLQGSVRGLPLARLSRDTKKMNLPRRAVGYGVQATPLHVARAYAALATGSLPSLGVNREPRARVPLEDVVGEIALVQRGLRACVVNGTARKLTLLNELGAHGKTGTAEVGEKVENNENNAWFAGYLPPAGSAETQLCFCAVIYWVKDKVHGGDAAGQLVVDFLAAVQADATLQARYLAGSGR